ncbi:hypothetical protein ES708_34109 [subsurface metagenome]
MPGHLFVPVLMKNLTENFVLLSLFVQIPPFVGISSTIVFRCTSLRKSSLTYFYFFIMANIRTLKKEINQLTNELVSDCLTYLDLHPGENRNEVGEIISDTIKIRNEIIEKLNQQKDKENSKLLKKHYKKLAEKLYKEVHLSFERLSAISGR